jgi:hypothetical protein
VSPVDVSVGETTGDLGHPGYRHHYTAVVGRDDLAFEPSVAFNARLGPHRNLVSYKSPEMFGPAEPALEPWARDLELVATRRANFLAVDRRRDRLARRREGVEVDPTFAVHGHDYVPGAQLNVDQFETGGLENGRGDALYVV